MNAEQLKEFWDSNKSIQENYMDLGISYDPNVTIAIPKTKKKIQAEIMDIEEVNLNFFTFILSYIYFFKF